MHDDMLPSAGVIVEDTDAIGHGNVSILADASVVFTELDGYKRALDQHAIVGTTDRAGTITYVNSRFCEISQYRREELLGNKHSILNSGHHPRSFFVEMWKTIGRGTPWRGEICNRAKDGSLYWVDTTIAPLRNAAGRTDGYVSIRFDISARKKAEALQHDAETLLLDIIEALPDAIAAYDQFDRLQVFNSAYRQFYDRTSPAIHTGARFEDILRFGVEHGQFTIRGDSPAAREAWVARRLREHRHPGKASIQQLADGRWLQVEERRSPAGLLVGVRTDVTALKAVERRIQNQAERDGLTGLFNRAVLVERLSRSLRRSGRQGEAGALMIIDLDNFKDVNDKVRIRARANTVPALPQSSNSLDDDGCRLGSVHLMANVLRR